MCIRDRPRVLARRRGGVLAVARRRVRRELARRLARRRVAARAAHVAHGFPLFRWFSSRWVGRYGAVCASVGVLIENRRPTADLRTRARRETRGNTLVSVAALPPLASGQNCHNLAPPTVQWATLICHSSRGQSGTLSASSTSSPSSRRAASSLRARRHRSRGSPGAAARSTIGR